MTKITSVKHQMILVALVVAACLALMVRGGSAEIANAAPNTVSYEITWYTVDGGGAMNLTGGTYTLSGTAGQPDAGMQSGGSYALSGGFWSVGLPDIIRNFLPFIAK